MSTNFYLRRTKPILCFPEFHVAKRSCGWKPLLEHNGDPEDSFSFTTARPIVERMDDIRAAVESGEWELIDEYDRPYDFNEFKSYLDDNFKIEDERKSHRTGDPWVGIIESDDGYEMCYGRFS